MFDLKRIITDILAYVLGIGTAISVAVAALPADAQWYIVAIAVVVAVVSWFNGRNGDGSKKSVPSKV